jgi:NNP family nitrate/nitrite transporter-like MFS transporter
VSAGVPGLDRRAFAAALGFTSLLAAGIVLGSGNLRNYDPLLLTYTFGTLFAAFAAVYRTALWLQRPPTWTTFRRAWGILRAGGAAGKLAFLARNAAVHLGAQRFIAGRGFLRWFTHALLAWGCMLAGAVTFPLVFGWMTFETPMDDPALYHVMLFGLKVGQFHTTSPVRFAVFNLLNVSAVMVTAGALLSLHRRLKDPGSRARQQFGQDLVPLLLLLAISLTGLMLTFSMHLLEGAGYPALSLVHAVAVVGTLLYLPFGKFFHVVQRPAHLAVMLARREGERSARAACASCGGDFASAMQVEDLGAVLERSGAAVPVDLCPPCKRRRVVRLAAAAVEEA